MKEFDVKAEYDPETGVSTLIKMNKYGTFRATAIVDDEDKLYANQWDGLRFCEYKIDTQVAHAKAVMLRERMNGIKAAIQSIEPPAEGEEDYTYEKLLAQYRDARRRYKEQCAKYKSMKARYVEYTEAILHCRKEWRERIDKFFQD